MQITTLVPVEVELVKRPFERGYREYVLRYRPQPTPGGRYLAYVIVLRNIVYVHTVNAIMPDLASFPTEDEAANAGWAAGVSWVDKFEHLDHASRGSRMVIRPSRMVSTLRVSGQPAAPRSTQL
jgi:hypothetical protein